MVISLLEALTLSVLVGLIGATVSKRHYGEPENQLVFATITSLSILLSLSLTYAILKGVPSFPPLVSGGWIFYLPLIVLLVIVLDEFSGYSWHRWCWRFPLTFASFSILTNSVFRRSSNIWIPLMVLSVLSIAVMIFWWIIDGQIRTGYSRGTIFMVYMAFMAGGLLSAYEASMFLGQLSLTFLATVLVVHLMNGFNANHNKVVTFYVFVGSFLWLYGWVYGSINLTSLTVIFLSPLLGTNLIGDSWMKVPILVVLLSIVVGIGFYLLENRVDPIGSALEPMESDSSPQGDQYYKPYS